MVVAVVVVPVVVFAPLVTRSVVPLPWSRLGGGEDLSLFLVGSHSNDDDDNSNESSYVLSALFRVCGEGSKW